MPAFTEDSPWQDWVTFCRQTDSARPDFDPDERNCPVTTWARSRGEITLGAAVRRGRGHQAIQAMLWILTTVLDRLPETLRAPALRVVAQDPPMAAWLYGRGLPLSEIEKHILWDAFAETMPVTREKAARLIGAPDA